MMSPSTPPPRPSPTTRPRPQARSAGLRWRLAGGRSTALGASLAACLTLVGCATAPKRLPRDATKTPGEWSTPAEPGGPADAEDARAAAPRPAATPWWTQLEDPVVAALVEEALVGSFELEAAAARLEASFAAARVAAAARRPSVGAGLDALRSRRNFIGFPLPGGEEGVLSTTSTVVSAGLEVSWEADLWGRLDAARRAAVADAAAEAAELEAARLSLAGEVARAARALAHARERRANQREVVSAWESTRAALRARFAEGLVPAERVRIAAASLAGAQSDLEAWEEVLDATTRRLEILLGRTPSGTIDVAPELPSELPDVPVGLPAEVIARRADLVASERRLDAAAARIEVAERARYPRFSLTGSAGRESEDLGRLLDGDFSVWSIFGGLVAPIFEGGRLRADVDAAEAAGDAAVAEHAAAVLRALGEVETALVAERRAGARVRELAVAVSEAAQARREAGRRYREGLVDLPTLYDGRRLQLEAEGRLLDARRELADARVDLHLALGGAFVEPAASEDGRSGASNEVAATSPVAAERTDDVATTGGESGESRSGTLGAEVGTGPARADGSAS